jgi:hypothetical protein
MNKTLPTDYIRLIAAVGVCLALTDCGGGGGGGSSNAPQPGEPLATNQISLILDAGPPGVRALNELFTSVTICAPGTSNCQTIDHVLVDTGSSGLRVMASVVDPQLLSSLPQSTDPSGNPMAECAQFVDGYAWGPTRIADIRLAGETAANASIQVIGEAGFAAVPTACSSSGPAENTVQTFGANGSLGIGVFAQDCGQACVTQSDLGWYYSCLSGNCSSISVPLAQQLWNPIALFATDSNGSSIQLPAAPSTGATTLVGTLTFGVDTQPNNALGTAKVLTVDATYGELASTVQGVTYPFSFLDSGSNGYFYGTNLFPLCGVFVGFYCPVSAVAQAGVLQGANGITFAASFVVGNPETLLAANPAVTVDPDIAGLGIGGLFDWGLPFFLGRTIFTVIENQATSAGTGPIVAIE